MLSKSAAINVKAFFVFFFVGFALKPYLIFMKVVFVVLARISPGM